MPNLLTPPKCWTQSQQAQQDEQESSLVTEILSDDEKQQKSRVEVQRVSKSSASPFDSQPSSQGEGDEPIPKETDLQDPGNKDELAVKEVAKLNTKNKVQMKALSEAHAQCYVAYISSVHRRFVEPSWDKSINRTSSNWGPQGIV